MCGPDRSRPWAGGPAVNAGLVTLYWHVGKRIRQEILGEERAAYGEQIVTALSTQLTAEYGRGSDRSNVFRMVQFAERFPDEEIVAALRQTIDVDPLPRADRHRRPLETRFYAEMCPRSDGAPARSRTRSSGWSMSAQAVSKKPEAGHPRRACGPAA